MTSSISVTRSSGDLEENNDVAYIDDGTLPLDGFQYFIHFIFKSFWSNLQPVWHPCVPVHSMMGKNIRLVDVPHVRFYLPVASIGIKCEKYLSFLKGINALIHSTDRVAISLSYCVRATIVDIESQAFIFLWYENDQRCPLCCVLFDCADFDHLLSLFLFQLSLPPVYSTQCCVNRRHIRRIQSNSTLCHPNVSKESVSHRHVLTQHFHDPHVPFRVLLVELDLLGPMQSLCRHLPLH